MSSNGETAGAIRQCVAMSRRFAGQSAHGDLRNWKELCRRHETACGTCLNCPAAQGLRIKLIELHDWDEYRVTGALKPGMVKGDWESRPNMLRVDLVNAADALCEV